jgi:hypothetical protein
LLSAGAKAEALAYLETEKKARAIRPGLVFEKKKIG